VTQDHLATIQMSTSKADVQVKLSVIDDNEEMISSEGRGHVVLPSYIFRRDPATANEEPQQVQSSSRSCEDLLFMFS
jgi:hypothetical protein